MVVNVLVYSPKNVFPPASWDIGRIGSEPATAFIPAHKIIGPLGARLIRRRIPNSVLRTSTSIEVYCVAHVGSGCLYAFNNKGRSSWVPRTGQRWLRPPPTPAERYFEEPIAVIVVSPRMEDPMDAQQTGNFPSSSSSAQRGSGRSITDHANEALRQVTETAQQVQDQAKDAMADLSSQATANIKDLLNHQVKPGQNLRVALRIRSAARLTT